MTVIADTKRCGGPCGRTLSRDRFSLVSRRRPYCYYMCRECVAGRKRALYAEAREQALIEYGGCCAACGDDRLMALDLEHVNSDGGAERARDGVPNHAWLKRLLDGPRRLDLQVLCGSCHNIKTRGGDPFVTRRT